MSTVTLLRQSPVLALVALVACGFGSTVREQVHQTVADPGSAAIHLSNDAGSVTVTAWDKPTVDIQAVKSADSLQGLREMTVAVRRGPGGIYIQTQYTGSIHQGGVRYTLSVPANAALDVRNGAGSVTVGGTHANVTVDTQAGSITADLGTVAGSRAVALNATTGSVRLTIARDSSAKVDAHSSVGSVHSDFGGVAATRQNVVGASAAGTIGAGSARIHLSTTTGSITLAGT